jgi:hypothetical protein
MDEDHAGLSLVRIAARFSLCLKWDEARGPVNHERRYRLSNDLDVLGYCLEAFDSPPIVAPRRQGSSLMSRTCDNNWRDCPKMSPSCFGIEPSNFGLMMAKNT